jgi:radical SAM superfamily enzyme YgiQ (UPF0313 family)
MKVLLVNPPIREWAKPNCFPEGLGILASCLKKAGHDVEALDINAHRYTKEKIVEIIGKSDYDLIGMGGLITVYGYMGWFADICKQLHPGKPVILGGNAVTPIPHLIMKNTRADIACIGEGEETLVEVADAIENKRPFKGIPGIWYRNKDGTIINNDARKAIADLDTIPWADRDMFPTEIYVNNSVGTINSRKWIDGEWENTEQKVKSFIVRLSRGCPYRCTFCYHDFMGQRFRLRSPEAVFKEIKYLVERYSINYFGLGDDMATADRKRFSRLCRMITDSKIGIKFFVAVRANLVTEDFLILLKDSGCEMVCMGIESASQKILDTMKKQVTVEEQRRAVQLVKKHFGWVDATFIIGYPGETMETVRETVDFCNDMELEPEAIFYATPYPGTWLYEEALRRNLIKDEHSFLLQLHEQGERPVVNFTDWSDEKLIEIKEETARKLNAWNKEFTADGKMTRKRVA